MHPTSDDAAARQFRQRVDKAAKLFWADVERSAKLTALDTRKRLTSLSTARKKKTALFTGAEAWRDECRASFKTLFERFQKLAAEYPAQIGDLEQRSGWINSATASACNRPFMFSDSEHSLFHEWLSCAVADAAMVPNPPYPPTEKLTYPRWFDVSMQYQTPSALSAMFRSLDDDLNNLHLSALVDGEPNIPAGVAVDVSADGAKRTPNSKRKSRRQSRATLKRKEVIFSAIQANLRGPKYCAHIDRSNLLASEEWRSEKDWPGQLQAGVQS
jgi:hypothetical protein